MNDRMAHNAFREWMNREHGDREADFHQQYYRLMEQAWHAGVVWSVKLAMGYTPDRDRLDELDQLKKRNEEVDPDHWK